MLARPYTLGDRIEVGALTGNVHKIDWRSTAMMNNQGDLLILPNAKLAQETIINHSSPTSVTGRFIEIGVHYRHPPNQVKKLLLESCASVREALREPEPEPEIYVLNFADSAITYRLRFFIHEFSERYRIDSKVREAIWYHFHREGVEIPFPIRTIYHAAPERRAIFTSNHQAQEISEVLAERKMKTDLARQEAQEERSSRGPVNAGGEGLHVLSNRSWPRFATFSVINRE